MFKVFDKAREVTVSMAAFSCHCTCHCRCSSELSNSLLPPRGQDAAANGEQHHSCLCADSWWWSLVSATVEVLSFLLEGQFLYVPFAFQISCESIGRMHISSTLPHPTPRKEPGKGNPQTSSPWDTGRESIARIVSEDCLPMNGIQYRHRLGKKSKRVFKLKLIVTPV